MSDKKHFHDAAEARHEKEAAETAAYEAKAEAHEHNSGKPGSARDSGAAMPDPADVIEKLNAENQTLKEQIMRMAADMENLRKRTARDIADAKTYAVSAFARDMLSVADNLGRALDAIPAEARDEDSTLKSLSEGVEMTERAMMSALHNHGVRKIAALGQRFDPHWHQAMFEAEDKSVPHNTVNHELQAGYAIGDRVLRAAQVGVAKGGEKESEPEQKQTAPKR